jgi:hypothetical protein
MSQNYNQDSFELYFKPFSTRPFEIGNDHRKASLAPSASESSTYDLDGSTKGMRKGGGPDELISVNIADASTSNAANSKTTLDWERDRYDDALLNDHIPTSPVEYRLYKRRWVGVIALVRGSINSRPLLS